MPANDVPHSIAVSRPALIARIERTLRRQHRELRSRAPFRRQCRQYLIIDSRRHVIVDCYVDLVTLGRDLGCLEPWEQLAAR
jgi:hypothetical protein